MTETNSFMPNIRRRSFIQGGAALTAGLFLTGNGFDIAHAEGTIDLDAPVEKKYTVCDMCNQVPKCGLTAYVQDDKIVRIESREPHPVTPLCAKGIASIQELYDPNRLMKPRKRTNAKGTGKSEWEEITWDEAYETIASELNRVKEESGADAVMFYVGDPKEPRPAVQRLANLFGTSSYGLESSLCSTATNMASQLVLGRGWSAHGSPPTEETQSCIIWSLNAAWSQPNRHRGFMDHKERGCKFVIVDPRITPTVTGLADVHLQLRPGSDGALALGFMHIIINDELYDKDFIENWTVGFEGLKELVQEYTPEKVEEITWVPADKLKEAVYLLAENSPSTLISSSAGLAHATNVGNSQRAVFMIPALLGMIEKAGGYTYSGPAVPFGDGSTAKFKGDDIYEAGGFVERRHDRDDFPVWVDFNKHFQTARLPEYVDQGLIKAAVLVAANVMIWPETNVYQEALNKLEFAVAVDYYERPWTHDYVDILLPAAMCHERKAPFMVYGKKIYYRDVVVTPQGEAREDWQIMLELGCALGFEEECFGGNVEAAFNYILETSGTGITLDDLKANMEDGYVVETEPSGPGKHEAGKLRKDGEPGFNTPSKKVEFDSEVLKKHGFGGLPIHQEPVHSPYNPSESDKAYPLVLNTGSRLPYYTHSKLREIPWLNQFMPDPVVRIHPKDARDRGISDGDDVKIFNQQNEVKMKAQITNMVLPGAVDIFHGWAKADINLLISRDFCPITGFPPFRSCLCEVAPV